MAEPAVRPLVWLCPQPRWLQQCRLLEEQRAGPRAARSGGCAGRVAGDPHAVLPAHAPGLAGVPGDGCRARSSGRPAAILAGILGRPGLLAPSKRLTRRQPVTEAL